MIAIVVPTIRQDRLAAFKNAWKSQIERHGATLIIVHDGDEPTVEHDGARFTAAEIMGGHADLIFNKNDGVRNLGFAFIAARLPEVEYIVSLDDDVAPHGDTISDHLAALKSEASLSWMNTVNGFPVRGLPHTTRAEAPVMLSHGLWVGVPDVDALTQLHGYPPTYEWYKGSIPKGAYFPLCAMNFAFRREALPYVYQAPMGPSVGLDRFADIWSGISLKRTFDKLGWAVVTGYAAVDHQRASDVFTNLLKEAEGRRLNESFWKESTRHPYFASYARAQRRWERWVAAQHRLHARSKPAVRVPAMPWSPTALAAHQRGRRSRPSALREIAAHAWVNISSGRSPVCFNESSCCNRIHPRAIMQRALLPSKKAFEIVVAAYKEDLTWTRRWARNATIYSKSQSGRSYIMLPNWGREAGTYLYHIVTRYDALADTTLFVQGHPFDHLPYDVSAYARTPADFFGTMAERRVSTLDAWWTKEPQKIDAAAMRAFLELIGCDPRRDAFHVTWGAQFAASKRAIQSRPRSYYENLLRISQQQEIVLAGRRYDNHHIGFLFELFWHRILTEKLAAAVTCSAPASARRSDSRPSSSSSPRR